jgi:hypothetical protein
MYPYQTIPILPGTLLLIPNHQSNDDMDALLELAAIYGKPQMIQIAARFGRTFETNIPTLIDEAVEWSQVVLGMDEVDEIVGGEEILDVMAKCMILSPEGRKGAGEIMEECEILHADGRRMGKVIVLGEE